MPTYTGDQSASGDIVNISAGLTLFYDTSTAGSATITNIDGGRTWFYETSTAGSATIINNSGGTTAFDSNSTAGSATITTNSGGGTYFYDTSTAGSATITTNSGGKTHFYQNSTAGSARLIAEAGGVFDFSYTFGPNNDQKISAGSIEGAGTFSLGSKQLTVGSLNTDTTVSGSIQDGGIRDDVYPDSPFSRGASLVKVGTGTLTLSGSNTYTGTTTVSAGTLSLAGGSAIADGAAVTVAAGAGLTLSSSETIGSLAGAGTVALAGSTLTLGGLGATTTFSGVIGGTGALIKAGLGTLTLSGTHTYTGGTTINQGTLELGTADVVGHITGSVSNNSEFSIINSDLSGTTISNNSGSSTSFYNSSTAGSSTITNNSGGDTYFYGNSTAGNASITTNSSSDTYFYGNSTAGNASIINNSGSVTYFRDTSTAGSATITNSGSHTYFRDTSTAGSARLIAAAGGLFDFSDTTGPNDDQKISAGSIEGAGAFRLGSNELTVGSLNTDTAVSGTIYDSGIFGGSGASLVKVGTGTLMLSGNNTYSGGTTLRGGTLVLGSAQGAGTETITFTSGAQTLQLNAAALGEAGGTFGNTLANLDAEDTLDLRGLTYAAGAAAVLSGSTLMVTSGGVSESFTLSGSYAGLSFRAVNDGAGGVAIEVNGAPEIDPPLPDASTPEDVPFNYTFSADAFSDPDGDTLTYTATLADGTALPSWLSFTAATRTFSGTPPANFNGFLDVKVTASDGSLGADDTFRLTVAAVNDAPSNIFVLGSSLKAAEFTAAGTVVGTVQASDVDSSSFTYSLVGDAGGRFEINRSTGQITVAKGLLLDHEQAASHTVRVLATDSGGLSVLKEFSVAVTNIDPENVTGDAEANTLMGGALADTFRGEGGVDTLTGGLGNDTLAGGEGADKLLGGQGNDTYYVTAGDKVTELAGEGSDTVVTWSSFSLGAGQEIEYLRGRGTADLTLTGNAGVNRIYGGDGNDTLTGGGGRDLLNGGDGADTFVWRALSDSGLKSNVDRDMVSRFGAGDKLDLSALGEDLSFIGTEEFSGAAGQIRYLTTSANTYLYFDADGNKVADFSVQITGVHTLTADHFVL